MMNRFVIFVIFILITGGCSVDEDYGWNDPVIPVTLKGIEAINIDNSGEFPIITASSVKKEAYMIGIKWIADNIPTDEDKFITGPIQEGEQTYNSIADNYSKAIMCLTSFNSDIPAGTYVSKFFKEINRNYLPTDVNEGFVLLLAPNPGKHSFRVEYYDGEELMFSYDTSLIEFF
jgi:hypothetical protein